MDDFCTWEDLLDRKKDSFDPLGTSTVQVSGYPAPDANVTIDDVLERKDVPEDLKELLRKRQELEEQFKFLTGQTSNERGDDPERLRKMYPVFAHTKESRLLEKRIRLRDERRAAAQKRKLEAGIIRRQKQREDETARADERERQRVHTLAEQHKRNLAAQQKTKQKERIRLRAVRDEREAENRANALRRLAEEHILQFRWQEERNRALKSLSIEKVRKQREESRERERYLDERRKSAIGRQIELRLRSLKEERRRDENLERKRFA